MRGAARDARFGEPMGASGVSATAVLPMLGPDFVEELSAARRRVTVLEEANRAIQESIDRITRLSSFSEGLDRIATVGEVADLLFEEIRGVLPLDGMVLALVDLGNHEFRAVKVEPPEQEGLATQELEAQVAAGMFGWALGLRRPTMVDAACFSGHLILVPLATARRTVGMLIVVTPLAADAVEQQHLTLAAVVARQAAQCIDNLWLAEDIRRQHEAARGAAEAAAARRLADLGLLVETADAVGSTPESGEALRILIEAACRHLGVRTAAIAIRESEGDFTVAREIGLPRMAGRSHAATDHACPLERVASGREPVALERIAEHPEAECAMLVAGEGVSFLGVPLIAHDRMIGAISVMTDAPRVFTSDEVALLKGLGAQAAGAIENARLFRDLQGQMHHQQQALGRLVQSAHLASVGLLAGGVAHDINNPLCIISNHLQLLRLRAGTIPPEVQEALQSIETSVGRITGSIEALLEYACIRPGEQQPSDVNETMRRILVLLQYHPLCRRISVLTEFAEGLPPVRLDRAGWEQLMLELVTNAREAMEAGGRVRITTRRVTTGEGSPETPWIEVVIEDDGPGIPPAELSRIFDPFYTTRSNKRGMGMGLKICRDIVEAHGGRLHLESDGRRGTRVVIHLPPSSQSAPANDGPTTV